MAGTFDLLSVGRWAARRMGFAGAGLYGETMSLGSDADEQVDDNATLAIATAYRCIRLISETVAMLPCMVYRDGGSRREEARRHPLYSLLHDSPNQHQTAFEFWEAMVMGLATYGNAYALKDKRGDGAIIALTPLRPDRVKCRREDGQVLYDVTWDDGRRDEFPSSEIWHIRGWGGGYNLLGASPISLGRHSLGLARATDRAAGRFYANGMRPSGVIGFKQVLKQWQRDRWREHLKKFSGSREFGKYLTLEGDATYQQLGLSAADSELLASRAFNVEEVCRLFGVPPFLVFHTKNSTSWGTGLEQQQLGFLIFSLMPYLERIEQSAMKHLVLPAERQVMTIEFNVEGILRADSAARAEFYQKAINSGWMKPSEARWKENLPHEPGADRLFINSTMVPLDQAGQARPSLSAVPPGEDREPAQPIPLRRTA